MRLVRSTPRFRKSLKRILKSGRFNRDEIQSVIEKIAEEKLDTKYRDHQLSSDMKDLRECHIRPDLLLIYKIENNNLVLVLINIGSHSDLFK